MPNVERKTGLPPGVVIKTEWDLSPLLPLGDTDPYIGVERDSISDSVASLNIRWRFIPTYLESPTELAGALADYADWKEKGGSSGRSGYYFTLRTMQDQRDPELRARLGQITDRAGSIDNSLLFFTHSISSLPKEKQEEFLADPALSEYRHYLERLWEAKGHLLREEGEMILRVLGEHTVRNWTGMSSDLLSGQVRTVVLATGEEREVALPALLGLISHPDKETRDVAAIQLNDILAGHADIATHEINALLQYHLTSDQLRKFGRPDAEKLFSDDMDPEVVDAMIEVVGSRFDLPQRFYALKARLLGLEKLAYHERSVEHEGVSKAYTFEEACGITYEALGKLDPEFAHIFLGFVQNGQIDAFPRPGKKGGAECIYDTKNTPVYTLLNFNGTSGDVAMIGHEAGHGVNDVLMGKAQNQLNYGTSTATAEVASTLTESAVYDELIAGANDDERLALMITKLHGDVGAIFRQVACYKFETELHNTYRTQGYVSKEKIGEVFKKHMAAYMGDAVEQSVGSENWWIQWPHIRKFFYVYTYASGYLIAKSLHEQLKKDPAFIDRIKGFLSAGTSASPKDIFQNLGIDITDPEFWNQGIEQIEKLLDDTEALAVKLGKLNPQPTAA